MKKFILAATMLVSAVTVPWAQAQTFHVLHEFNGALSGNGLPDGANPTGKLILDGAGNLYGSTFAGGAGKGVLFKIDPQNRETVFFTFQGLNGESPATPLLLDRAGILYGIADGGPAAGLIFKISQVGQEKHLFDFLGGLQTRRPGVPTGGILKDNFGNTFGTTFFGGNGACQFNGCGSIYKLDFIGRFHVLHNFNGNDGSRPFGPLVQDAAGNLYGVTQQGGNLSCPGLPSESFPEHGCGAVFKLSKNGVLTILHAFSGGAGGAIPQPGLLLDASGNLYGSTLQGGTSDFGILFKIAANGAYRVLHRFGGPEGSHPNGGLVSDSAGNLYGTAQFNGGKTLGNVFKLTPAGQLKVLHAFTGGNDGATPLAGVILDGAGNIYGTTVKNFLIQQVQGGSVFKITP